jgi:hypothetical protein
MNPEESTSVMVPDTAQISRESPNRIKAMIPVFPFKVTNFTHCLTLKQLTIYMPAPETPNWIDDR